jgi:hypothetical protein
MQTPFPAHEKGPGVSGGAAVDLSLGLGDGPPEVSSLMSTGIRPGNGPHAVGRDGLRGVMSNDLLGRKK